MPIFKPPGSNQVVNPPVPRVGDLAVEGEDYSAFEVDLLEIVRSTVEKKRAEDTSVARSSAPSILGFINSTTSEVNSILSSISSPPTSDLDAVEGEVCRIILAEITKIDSIEEIERRFSESLALESTLLPSQLHTALDDVSTLESSMSAVTGLLSAFAEIVEEQSEVVGEINRQANTAKEEVEKGGGELRTAKKHIEATSYAVPAIIVVMGWTLLFVNWYTP
ncbi:hypothetical protein TrRE_jg2364 [Triparma retinervis]|uniref:t-SNARE coiled-coil homology domain-containing protein n=1 Tax=Triparma retinervis TaxID=2557542 RepID=A0A9W7DTY3_9STRA|nr:hypothetical protein TrRE_jg2364 [Triparma retinervis]